MPNYKKVAILGTFALVTQLVLTKYLYPLIGKTTQTLFVIGEGIEPASGYGGTQVGDKVLGYLSGYVPFDISNISVWIAMFIGAFLLTYAGMFLYEQKKVRLWQGKNLTQRLFAILLYGHVVLYLALLAMKWNVPGIATNLLIGVTFNLLLMSAILTVFTKKFGFPKI